MKLSYKDVTIVMDSESMRTECDGVVTIHDTYLDIINNIIEHRGVDADDYPQDELAKILKCIDRKLLKYGYKVIGKVEHDMIVADIEMQIDGKYEYMVTVTEGRIGGRRVFELAEHNYPSHGEEFSIGKTDNPTQINVFGYHKAFGGAIRSLTTKGNSTFNGRQPINVYV